MPKNVILHVGLPKTGTTTIQEYMRRKDENLRSIGFLYPGAQEDKTLGLKVNHPLMYNAITARENAPSEDLDVEACRRVVAQTFSKFRDSDLGHMIWSHENLALAAGKWDTKYLNEILGGAELRIVCFARYTDDWIESLYKEMIWGRASRQRAARVYARSLRAPGRRPEVGDGAEAQPDRSMLRQGAKLVGVLRHLRRILPWSEIVVRSYDADRQNGKVVSCALAAMGVPIEGAFADADDEAGLQNPTKSDLYSMLLYHLEAAQAGMGVIRDVAAAATKRDRRGQKFEPLFGRRFRFLSDDDVMQARAYYDELRQDYPRLPPQPPYVSKSAERSLSKEEGIALLDWLRPDISDAVFDQACAAYSVEPSS